MLQEDVPLAAGIGDLDMDVDMDAGIDNTAEIEEILAEWEAEEAHCDEARGRAEFLLPDRLPRLRGKQWPRGGWEIVPISPRVQEQLDALRAAAEEADGLELPAPEEDIDVEDGNAEEEAEEEEPVRKKARCASEVCPGTARPRYPCIFGQSRGRIGGAVLLDKGKQRCLFCDPKALEEAVKTPHGKRHITCGLRAWSAAGRQDIVDAATERLPEDAKPYFQRALQRPSRAAAAQEARANAQQQAREDEAKRVLEQRQSIGGPPGDDEARIYQRKCLDDRKRLQKKFNPLLRAQEEKDDSWRSPLATRFEEWCREHSWAACEKCHRMCSRPLRESNISGKHVPAATIKQCPHCKDGVGYLTVSRDDIPEELRGLSRDALWAICPLEVDVGPPVWAKQGYRVHTDMTRFWWRPVKVTEQINQLERQQDGDAALAAFRYLMASPGSSYKQFVEWHNKFLRRNAATLEGEWDRKLQLPRGVLEEVGIECAVWPHLYPRTNMCETYVRK